MDKTNIEASEKWGWSRIYMSETDAKASTCGEFYFALLMSVVMTLLWASLAVYLYHIAPSYTQDIINGIDVIIRGIVVYLPANIAVSLSFYSVFNFCRLIYYRYLS